MREDNYPLAASPEEIRRLRVQAESLADEAAILLDRIGLSAGMSCLDLGCGAGGIVDLMSARVGPSGRVLGVDVEASSLAAARAWADELGLTNVRFEDGSIFDHRLPAASFDLVHLRYVITTIGRHEEVVQAALSLVRPGGVLALEEADGEGIDVFPPHPAFEKLKRVLLGVFERVADPYAARRLYPLLLAAGLEDVDLRVSTARARAQDELADYLPQTVLSVRDAVAKFGLAANNEIDALIAECRAHLEKPDTVSTTSLVFQVWGRKPA